MFKVKIPNIIEKLSLTLSAIEVRKENLNKFDYVKKGRIKRKKYLMNYISL